MALNSRAAARPLSPHLQVWRFTLLMALSIIHRITGAANYAGTALLVWWLVALARGPEAYATFTAVATSWFGLLVLFGFTWSVMHHLFGGLRHLIWDTGHGLMVPDAQRLGLSLTIAALLATVLIWGGAFAVLSVR